MSQLIGKKGKNVEAGYVWAPYITVVSAPGFPNAKMASRYQNPKIKKIKKSSKESRILILLQVS